jgi:hypothetical protein
MQKKLILSPSFGGEMMTKGRRCTGMPGGKCAFQKKREVWGSEISILSI